MTYGRKRDDNERSIIEALRLAGACVQQLEGAGIPDLLVQFRAKLYLLEVKEPGQGANKRRSQGGKGVLTKAQVRFWTTWGQPKPSIVTTPEEALGAIGVVMVPR